MRRTGDPHDDPTGPAPAAGTAGPVRHYGEAVMSLPPPPPAPTTSVPRQVPPTDRYFVNRSAELARFANLGIQPDGPAPGRVSMVSGVRGAGKTAFAKRVAELVGDRFRDGELYVDFTALRSRVGGAAAVGEALAACLRSLGVADHHIPASTPDRANLFRTCTADRSVLLVLDDVTEPRQVRDLLPKGPDSAVLATSDHRMGELVSFDGAEVVMLNRLEPRHAHDVLTAICGADRLTPEPDAVAELVDEVRDGLDALSLPGQDSVASVFTAAYEALPDDAQRLYRIAGAVPGLEFTPHLAAVALDLPVRAARPAFAALHTANLVEDRPGHRRPLLSLVAQHAAAVAREAAANVDTAALRRIAAHYAVQAVHADVAVMTALRLRPYPVDHITAGKKNPFTDAADAQRWFADERTTLMAVLRLCHARGWHEQAMVLASSLSALFLNRRSPTELIEVSNLGADAAQAANRPDVRIDLLLKASRGYLDQKRLELAKHVLDGAQSLAEQHGDAIRLASVWEHLGRYYDEVDVDQAIAAYERSITWNRQAADGGDRIGVRGAAFVTYFLARPLLKAGRHDEALTALRSAIEELRAIPDERMAARALASLGTAYHQMGRHQEAADTLISAVRIFAARGAMHYEGETLEALAEVAEHLGDHAAAQQALTRAAQILEASGSPRATELRAKLDPPSR